LGEPPRLWRAVGLSAPAPFFLFEKKTARPLLSLSRAPPSAARKRGAVHFLKI
jgi:hypothetical protein